MKQYQEALIGTTADKVGAPEPESALEKECVERFKDFFSAVTPESVRQKAEKLYSKDAYFNDTLRTHYGAAAIKDYFLRSAEECEIFKVDFTDVARSGENFYFRWVMSFAHKRVKKGRALVSIGMSHIRFNKEGKVVMHQDYWDSAAGFFDHVPVLGRVLSGIRRLF